MKNLLAIKSNKVVKEHKATIKHLKYREEANSKARASEDKFFGIHKQKP